MPVTLHEVADALHSVFTTDADAAARSNGLVLRERKFTGQAFVQTVAFGWLETPKATLKDLAEFASDNHLGKMTKQGLDNWFCPAAVLTLQETFHQALYRCIGTPARRTPLLNRFCGVYLVDGTSCSLDPSLAAWLPGCGGNTPGAGAAAIKLVVTLEITSGRLEWVNALPGRAHDQAAEATLAPFEPGALLLFDLGFFNLDMLQQQDAQGVKWLCRIQSQTTIRFTREGDKQSVARFLNGHQGNRVEREVWVGSSHRLRCRLLAQRVPPDVAAKRREALLKDARSKGQVASEERLAMCEWTVFITNTIRGQLTLEEALVLYRVRWQIELLFKVWKSEGELDQSRGGRLSEQTGARRIRKRAGNLLQALLAESFLAALVEVLSELAAKLREWCQVEKRKTDPNTRQRLQEAEEISRLQADLSLA